MSRMVFLVAAIGLGGLLGAPQARAQGLLVQKPRTKAEAAAAALAAPTAALRIPKPASKGAAARAVAASQPAWVRGIEKPRVKSRPVARPSHPPTR
jgi:hypothetical protein